MGDQDGDEPAVTATGAPLPAKVYFRIGEVAELVGVEPHVLRYWEREFRTVRPTKSARGQRVYTRRDVESLLRVRELLYKDGFTIAGARKKLRQASAPHPVEAGRTRKELLAMRQEVEAFLAELGPSPSAHREMSTTERTAPAVPAAPAAPAAPQGVRNQIMQGYARAKK